jgi:hypothetical protein
MKLEELFLMEDLSARSLNVCIYNDLKELSDVIKYYHENRTFKNLRNCGSKSDKELIKLCLKYEESNNKSVEKLFITEEISFNTKSSCLLNGLNSINEILKYYKNKKTFENLIKTGSNSKKELVNLCLKYEKNEKNELIIDVNNLNRIQREIINLFIEFKYALITKKSKNSLSNFLNGDIKIRNIYERIIANDSFDISQLKYIISFDENKQFKISNKSIIEIQLFIDSIIDFIIKINNIQNELDLIVLGNRLIIEKIFELKEIPIELLESLSIFKLIDFLITKNVIFEKKQNEIFKKAFKIYNGQNELTLDDLAKTTNLSRERVRQIRKICTDEFINKFKFIKNIKDDIFDKYSIDISKNFIFINKEYNDKINKKNNTNFSNEFISLLIYIFNSDDYDLIGNIEDVFLPKNFESRNRHNWDNFFVVNKIISNDFNFVAFADDLERRLNEQIDENYYFNFKGYLLKFSSNYNIEILNKISIVAENILNNEFEIYLDIHDNLHFYRTSQKQAHEYAYEALKYLGKPSKLHEIIKKIKELQPDYKTDEGKVRASISRVKTIVPLGRSSIYGLKEWENEWGNFKGGTIRSIVSKFLETEVDPKHISEITKYVLSYRPITYKRSVMDNLKADETNTFVFFKNSHIGLSNKIYDKTFVSLNYVNKIEIKSWEESYSNLIEFLKFNNRIPSSSGCPEDEIKLYRWFKDQERKIINGKIDKEKRILIIELINELKKGEAIEIESLSNKKIRKYIKNNSIFTFDNLIDFLNNNKRMPDSRDPDESSLYQYYYRNKKNLENIDTLSAQEAKLVDLIEKFGTSKHPKYTIDELMEFIKINKRMPNSRTTNERGLYQFAYKQIKLFEKGEINQLEVDKFVEISKIIQNHKYENKRN